MSANDSTSKDFLGFDPNSQKAIVGWMLTDSTFFLKCKQHIDYTYFQDPLVSEIVKSATPCTMSSTLTPRS